MLQSEVVRLIARRRWVAIPVFCVTIVTYAVVMMHGGDSFESRAVLRFHSQNPPSISAGGLEQVPLHEPFTREDLELVLADPRFSDEVRDRLVAAGIPADAWRPGALRLDRDKEGERFLVALVTGPDPETTARVLECAIAVLDEFCTDQFHEARLTGRARWAELSERAENDRRARLGAVQELRARAGVPVDGVDLVAERVRIETDLSEIARQRFDAETRRAEIAARQGAADEPAAPGVLIARLAETPAAGLVERTAERWIAAELELARRRGSYSETHPDVIEAKRVLEIEKGLWSAIFDPETALGSHITAVLSRFSTDLAAEDHLRETAELAACETRVRSLVAWERELTTRRARLAAVSTDLIAREEQLELSSEVADEIARAVRTLDLGGEIAPEILTVHRSPQPGRPVGGPAQTMAIVVVILASLLAYGAALGVDVIDPRLRDVTDAPLPEGISCLGVLPAREDGTLVDEDPVRALVGRLAARLGTGRVLLVAGRGDAAARRAVSEGIARAAAHLGTRTLIVRTDLVGREEGVATDLRPNGTPADQGLSEFLRGECDAHGTELEAALAASEADPERPIRLRPSELPLPGAELQRVAARGPIASIIRPTALPRLSEVVAGGTVSCATALLNSIRMGRFLMRVRRQFPLVVIDTVDLDLGSDALLLARGADAVVHVSTLSRTTSAQLAEDLAGYGSVRAPLIGTVFVRTGATPPARAERGRTRPSPAIPVVEAPVVGGGWARA